MESEVMSISRIRFLKDAPIPLALKSLGIPAAISLMIGSFYNVVDTFFIGLLHDTAALGAATVLFPVVMLIGTIGLSFGLGAASPISRRLGEDRKDEASIMASTAFFTTLALGLFFAIIGFIVRLPLLNFFGAESAILDKATVYGGIIILGSPFQMMNLCMTSTVRAEGAAQTSGVATALGAVLNIALDPIFIFVFNMGLAGAALATVVAQSMSTLFLLSFYLRRKSHLNISLKKFRPRWGIYGKMLVIGLPTLVRQFIYSLSMAVLIRAAARFGDNAIAAMGITQRIMSFPLMILFGFGMGFQTLAGYSYGAGDVLRLRDATAYAERTFILYTVFVAVILFPFSRLLASLFSQDLQVIEYSTLLVRAELLTLPFLGVQVVYGSLFQALGRGRPTLILAAAWKGFVLLPLIILLPRFWDFTGLAAAQPGADIFTALIAVLLVRRLRRWMWTDHMDDFVVSEDG